MEIPKISIIVPVYNVEQYLSRCIDSILNQTFSDFELLLIDDGSPDRSGEICDEFRQIDSRVRVIHKKNGGVSSARNIGLDNAKGEWIYFVDSDDTLFKDCLESLFSKTINNVDSIIGGYIETTRINVEPVNYNEIETIWNYKKALLDFYSPKYFHFNGYLWNRLFRHKVIQQHKLRFHEDIYYKEDGLFLVEFICKSKKDVFVTTKPIYRYYINPNGAMQSLKLDFNIKYLTNMDARILCWENVKEISDWYDFRLRFEAKRCIVQLYYIIINYYKIDDRSVRKSLYSKMTQYVSIPVMYRIYDMGISVINKIKSVLLCR